MTLQATIPQYNSLDMPMSVFIDALIDGNTDNIIDFPKVYVDFCEAVGGRELKQKIEEMADMVQLETKVRIAFLGIEMLELKPSEEIFIEVQKLGYHSSVGTYSEKDMPKFIAQILPYVKLDDVDAKILRARNNGGPKEGYTRDYFASMFNEFLLVFKVNVDDTITVRRYAQLVLRYKSHKKELEKQ